MSDYTDQSFQSNDLDFMELQLQQELQAMFDVDSQQHLQGYLQLVQQLNVQSWTMDMQEIYRAIHTIKGGSVTVGADACLKVATTLEDLLSDLRHLTPAPPLEDGQLVNLLQEAGELLASSLQLQGTGEAIATLVQPSVQRIQILHELVKVTYLADWDEQHLLHQEFAEQGFGLVTLNLEMAVANLSNSNIVPKDAVETALQTLAQLAEIGDDIGLKKGWVELLERCDILIQKPVVEQWQSQWPGYLAALQSSAQQGGVFIEPIAALPMSTVVNLEPAVYGESLTPEPVSQIASPGIDSPWEPSPFDDLSLDIGTLDNLYFENFNVGSEPIDLPGLGEDFDGAVDDLQNLSWSELEIPGELSLDTAQGSAVPLKHAEAPVSEDLISPVPPISLDIDLFSEVMDSLEKSQDLTGAIEEYANQVVAQLPESPEQKDAPLIQDDISNDDVSNLDDNLSAFAELEDFPGLNAIDAFAELPDLPDLIDEPSLTEDYLNLVDLSFLEDLAEPIFTEQAIKLPQDRVKPTALDPKQTVEVLAEELEEIRRVHRPEPKVSEVQIPVPLGRLDRTSQTLVETLLNLRSAQGVYQNLQSQLTKLFILAQDSVQYITELRTLQDSYALLDNLKSHHSTEGPTLERYRQGYITINRLLETSLRLSELGAEANKSAQQTSDSLKSLDRNVLQLRQTVEQSRLVPFSNLGFRARAILRDLTTRVGKPAQIIVEGEQIELDAATASKLEPALLHLIRNAYDHGLEATPDRISQGKPEQGRITLSLRRNGNRYLLELQDDGRGIDAQKIRQSAIAKGLPMTQTDTPAQLLAVLCQPGFSSQDVVSDISGRGVGMDVVAHQIETLGGRLKLETQVGRGTTFQLQFPAPQLLVSCVQVQVGDRMFAIPSQDIASTAMWDSLQTNAVEDPNSPYSWQIQHGESLVPGLDLSQYWQPQTQGRRMSDTAIALHIRASEQAKPYWIVVDDLLGQTELLITSLPQPLEAPVGILGISLQTDGHLVPVIDAALLAEVLSQPQMAIQSILPVSTPNQRTESSEPEELPHANRTILVVDDAALMRRRIEATLTMHGYTIVTCVDGQDAWNWLQAHTAPAMMITDVEMPNMDGFTLIDHVRQAGMTLPILVVSSRLAEEWSKEANRLGATDYLTKGFPKQVLLDKVKSLI